MSNDKNNNNNTIINNHNNIKYKIISHEYDLPKNIAEKEIEVLPLDTEAMGLQYKRDRLCVVQLLIDEEIHIVHFPQDIYDKSENLKNLLSNKKAKKIMHFARFDMAIIYRYLGVKMTNVVCTRTMSKIARTYSDKHGLKEVCRELLKVEMNKWEQSSYWGNEHLSDAQKSYAASDVVFLTKLYEKLKSICKREDRLSIAEKFFKILPDIIVIDNSDFDIIHLIEHH